MSWSLATSISWLLWIFAFKLDSSLPSNRNVHTALLQNCLRPVLVGLLGYLQLFLHQLQDVSVPVVLVRIAASRVHFSEPGLVDPVHACPIEVVGCRLRDLGFVIALVSGVGSFGDSGLWDAYTWMRLRGIFLEALSSLRVLPYLVWSLSSQVDCIIYK